MLNMIIIYKKRLETRKMEKLLLVSLFLLPYPVIYHLLILFWYFLSAFVETHNNNIIVLENLQICFLFPLFFLHFLCLILQYQTKSNFFGSVLNIIFFWLNISNRPNIIFFFPCLLSFIFFQFLFLVHNVFLSIIVTLIFIQSLI